MQLLHHFDLTGALDPHGSRLTVWLMMTGLLQVKSTVQCLVTRTHGQTTVHTNNSRGSSESPVILMLSVSSDCVRRQPENPEWDRNKSTWWEWKTQPCCCVAKLQYFKRVVIVSIMWDVSVSNCSFRLHAGLLKRNTRKTHWFVQFDASFSRLNKVWFFEIKNKKIVLVIYLVRWTKPNYPCGL